ncbi:MAG: hypothetical protein IKB73_06580 [Ruminococcus sp.]|nr:hypothetical protein [Ruminococcus sp.]
MTSKLSWIAFAPLTLAALAIKVIQLFFLGDDGTFYGLNSLMLSYIAIGCAVLVLLFAVIFCLIDKKIAPVYLINKNFVAGVSAMLLAIAFAVESANEAYNITRIYQFDALVITDIILTILCAIVFVVMGLNHFVGNGGVKGLSLFYLIPALWGAFRLVKCFLGFTTVSIAVTDVTELACYIFTTLFLFNYAMIIALMKGKSPVRSAFIFGMPAVTMLLSQSVFVLGGYVNNISEFDILSEIQAVQLFLLGIYILSFIIEMGACVKTKDEIEIIEDEETEGEYEDIKDPDADIVNALAHSVAHGNKPDEIVNKIPTEGYNEDHLAIDDEVYIEVAQASMDSYEEDDDADEYKSDFIYGAAPSDEDLIMPVESEEVEPEMDEEDASYYITKADSTYDEQEVEETEDVIDTIDKIDRLILEISEDELN